MFGSQILDIAIAMITFYLFISLICSAMREGIEAITKTRAMNIERAIRELLDDPGGMQITKALFDHPQLSGLFAGSYNPAALGKNFLGRGKIFQKLNMGYKGRANLPAYIPASNFAVALLDVTAKRAAGPRVQPPPPRQILSLDAVSSSISMLPTSQVQRGLQVAVDRANGDLAQAQKNLEDWFNTSMDRVSGWYKRRTQLILFLLGLAAAVVLNLDSFAVLDAVNTNKSLRDGLVSVAEVELKSAAPTCTSNCVPPANPSPADKAASPENRSDAAERLKSLTSEFQKANLQLGWQWDKGLFPTPLPQKKPGSDLRTADWVKIVLGWFVTALAVTLGAPFWFDTLSKFMSVRSSLKPDDKQSSSATAPPAPSGASSTASLPPPSSPPDNFVPNEWNAGYTQAGVL
jgi:hypothetical protein